MHAGRGCANCHQARRHDGGGHLDHSTGATLNASVNPEGSATTYIFVYGTDSTLSSGTTKTTAQSAGSGTSAESETCADHPRAGHDLLLRGASDQRGRHDRRSDPSLHYLGRGGRGRDVRQHHGVGHGQVDRSRRWNACHPLGVRGNPLVEPKRTPTHRWRHVRPTSTETSARR